MILANTSDVVHLQPEALPRDGLLPWQVSPRTWAEKPFEELIEMHYQQYLAQRALQELFENGVLQALES